MAAAGQKRRAVLSEECVGRRELFSGHSNSRLETSVRLWPACLKRCQDLEIVARQLLGLMQGRYFCIYSQQLGQHDDHARIQMTNR